MTYPMKKIAMSDLVAFAPFTARFPFTCDLVYAQGDHPENLFGQIYHPTAEIWGHRDIVRICLLAAIRLRDRFGWTLVIKDCLRTVEAQELIGKAPISLANPQWFVAPRMMSPPGMGAHPRAMAVDISVKDVDMGTVFDSMTPLSARDYKDFPKAVLNNRQNLQDIMVGAAADLGLPLHPLSNEWWDFRFPDEMYIQYAPLAEADLLSHQKMTQRPDGHQALVMDPAIWDELRGLV